MMTDFWNSRPKRDIERRLAQIGRGIVASLRADQTTIEQAQADLFNSDIYRGARKYRLDPALLEFLEFGMELEDVAELAPDDLHESYEQMEQLLVRVLKRQAGRRKVAK
jgi:hypothetical protein